MMDRLLAKGLLEREELDGGFQYRSTLTLDELRRRLFEQFVNSALGGSLQPFAAYLSGSARLTPEEKQTLEALIQKAESQEKDKS
ncbi:MAG TPA: BlaI/MecI/CopY family transcriptional regulator, partial [Fimbriimonadaceae bacterium]|nr:BlaI/MecI/CopY family transcriptional regulator [Fimbriimonadaceae bacterium]